MKKIFITHFANLSRLMSVSDHRLSLASELLSAFLITLDCYNSTTDNSPKSDMEKGQSLMRGLMVSINTNPQLLTKLIDVLNNVEACKLVAEKMQYDLSQLQ